MNRNNEILKEAAVLVKDGWSKFAGARNTQREIVPTGSPNARYFCTMGAICRAADNLGYPDQSAVDALLYFQKVNNIPNAIKWNDNFDREEYQVVDAFNWAVERSGSLVPEALGCG